MATEDAPNLQLKIAHVLFIDLVGYSKMLIDDQREVLDQMNAVIRTTKNFREAEAEGKLIPLPSGDGMALVFLNNPEAPVQCALEISKALQDYPQLKVRMGVHSGPVSTVTDVNGRPIVAGTGINMAQRVMDCGDAGHILLSKRAAADLAEYRQWQPHLHDLGACEVKHSVVLDVVNLYTGEVGNPEVPGKFKPVEPVLPLAAPAPIAPAKAKQMPWAIIGAAVAALVLAIAGLLYFTLHKTKPVPLVAAEPVPSPTASVPSPSPVTIPSAAPVNSPVAATPAAPEPVVVAQPNPASNSPLAAEFQEWKKMSLVTFDNSYLLEHARQRYAAWKAAADQGDPIGQFFVGNAYQHGLTVPEDAALGLEWLIKSAEQKNSDAMVAVAIACAFGIGTTPNIPLYNRWIQESLNAGNVAAMVTQGAGLYLLYPAAADKEAGKKLINQAADAGSLDGLFWAAFTSSNSPIDYSTKLAKAASGGQPDALLAQADSLKGTEQGKKLVTQAFKMMGNPLSVARIIDPTQRFGFYHANLYPAVAWSRLREMADAGSTEASRLVAQLKKSGKAP